MSVLRLCYANMNGWATLLFTLNTHGTIIVLKYNMGQSADETYVALCLWSLNNNKNKKNRLIIYYEPLI